MRGTTVNQPADRAALTVDPVTTEVIRHGLTGAAEQLGVALCRMAFSPAIYDMFDFTAGLFDRRFRLLAQTRSIPVFLGSLGLAVEAAVASLGEATELRDGDVLVSTDAYQTGSHAPDLVLIVPGFVEGELIGYAAVKAHIGDLGAKDPACADSTDIYQEGLILPTVYLERAGRRQEDIYRILTANSRTPSLVSGDVEAAAVAARLALEAVRRLITRHGRARFEQCVEAMLDHSATQAHRLIEQVPDGRYTADGQIDSDGIGTEPVPFTVAVEISGGDVVVDLTESPPVQSGPVNLPGPCSVGAARVAIMSIVGAADESNEGFFRSLQVRTTPGTMLHATRPAPVFLYFTTAMAVIDAIHAALADVMPDRVPAGNGGDNVALGFWGPEADGQRIWTDGANHPIGQGASAHGDGGSALHIGVSGLRFCCVEALEARGHLEVDRCELAVDSAGTGRHRGGLGLNMTYRLRLDASAIVPVDQTLWPAMGSGGGGRGRPTRWRMTFPDGTSVDHGKLAAQATPAGTVVDVQTGGGGGWGPPEQRNPLAVHADVRAGYVSEPAARRDYPHVFSDESQRG